MTEEDGASVPVMPSLNPATWRAVGEIPDIPTHQYSLLAHLRHLLAKDPTLQDLGLSGGLALWLYRNTGKLME